MAPHAQLRVGAAREKQKHYPEAVKAYERAADRYHDRPVIAAVTLGLVTCSKMPSASH